MVKRGDVAEATGSDSKSNCSGADGCKCSMICFCNKLNRAWRNFNVDGNFGRALTLNVLAQLSHNRDVSI